MNSPFQSSSLADESPWQRQRLRVPREDGAVFSQPALPEATKRVEENATLLNESQVDVQGRTLAHMRDWTRRKVLESAVDFTSYIRGENVVIDAAHGAGIIADGHQPSLFHPGVWVKNFAIAVLARKTGRVPLHLVVDNDTLTTSSMRVPVGDRERPAIEFVPFDRDRQPGPWEEAGILDPEKFATFGDRVTESMRRWGIDPLIADIWPDAVTMAKENGSLCDCFTAARHRIERRWGIDNLELPLSRLGGIDPFLWFASHLFAQAPRFRSIHNQVLGHFREINKVRSRTHPVPELARVADWTETPFWLWKAGDHIRRPAFVRQIGKEVELTDRGDITIRLPLTPEMDACCAVEVLRELPNHGIRLRTRALSTTLFARLCLSDLFVHGIGGAKYDEMTDRIIARFYGLPAPAFLTQSATVHLPLAKPYAVTDEEIRHLHQQLRDVGFNPDRHHDEVGDEAVDALIAKKLQLITEQQADVTTGLSRAQRREHRPRRHRRYLRFQEIDRQLQSIAQHTRAALTARMDALHQQAAANAVLKNREFSFSLYPESALRPLMERLQGQL